MQLPAWLRTYDKAWHRAGFRLHKVPDPLFSTRICKVFLSFYQVIQGCWVWCVRLIGRRQFLGFPVLASDPSLLQPPERMQKNYRYRLEPSGPTTRAVHKQQPTEDEAVADTTCKHHVVRNSARVDVGQVAVSPAGMRQKRLRPERL